MWDFVHAEKLSFKKSVSAGERVNTRPQDEQIRALAHGAHGAAFVDAITDATGARVAAASARRVGAAARWVEHRKVPDCLDG